MQNKDCQKLRECPFCGGEAILESNKLRYGTTYSAYCQKCGAEITGFSEHEAIAAWNRRANHIRDTTKMVSNADRIRSTSDEELARELLAMYLHGHCDCNEENGICITEQSLLDWLKQPVKEEHNEDD